jgi:hypothetical protein
MIGVVASIKEGRRRGLGCEQGGIGGVWKWIGAVTLKRLEQIQRATAVADIHSVCSCIGEEDLQLGSRAQGITCFRCFLSHVQSTKKI